MFQGPLLLAMLPPVIMYCEEREREINNPIVSTYATVYLLQYQPVFFLNVYIVVFNIVCKKPFHNARK
jgi:hypothetical protein